MLTILTVFPRHKSIAGTALTSIVNAVNDEFEIPWQVSLVLQCQVCSGSHGCPQGLEQERSVRFVVLHQQSGTLVLVSECCHCEGFVTLR
jgi:hypothetical protein